jgi:aspartate carbamoyltransferase regulatory subunit
MKPISWMLKAIPWFENNMGNCTKTSKKAMKKEIPPMEGFLLALHRMSDSSMFRTPKLFENLRNSRLIKKLKIKLLKKINEILRIK